MTPSDASDTISRRPWGDRPPRVLIARMSAIGDTILTTPVACRLRDAFPDAFLAWVVEEKSSRFIEGHPAVDETIVLPRGWFVSPRKVVTLARRLKPLALDVAIDCQSITKSSLACWLSGAPLRIGSGGQYGCELSPWLNNRLVDSPEPHLTDRQLALLAPLGLERQPGRPVRWDLPRVPGAEQAVARWAPIAEPEGFAVVNPGATWESKLWVNSRFGEVARRLGQVRGLRSVVVWAGDRERRWAEEIAAASGGWAQVAPPTSLPELAALLRQARLMLSADTGPMHLAVAVGAPTVGLFGATRPEDCGPYGAPHEAVQRRLQEGGRRARRNADNAAMRAITVDDAWAACQRVLDRTAQRFPYAPVAMAS